MKLKDMTKEELLTLSYTDIAYMILTESKKSLNTPAIFKQICDLLDYTDSEYSDKIGDFYTSLTTDRRFILLENAEWDLKDKHVIKVELEDEDENLDEEEIEEEIEELEEENIDEDINDDDLDDEDDDFDDLAIVEEDEELDED